MDLALSNLQKLICHKTQLTNQPTEYKNITQQSCFKYFYLMLITELQQYWERVRTL